MIKMTHILSYPSMWLSIFDLELQQQYYNTTVTIDMKLSTTFSTSITSHICITTSANPHTGRITSPYPSFTAAWTFYHGPKLSKAIKLKEVFRLGHIHLYSTANGR